MVAIEKVRKAIRDRRVAAYGANGELDNRSGTIGVERCTGPKPGDGTIRYFTDTDYCRCDPVYTLRCNDMTSWKMAE